MNLITQPRTLIGIFLYVHKKTIAISYYSSKITKKEAILRFRKELLKAKIRTKEERTLKETESILYLLPQVVVKHIT